jgi:hypothetical protein
MWAEANREVNEEANREVNEEVNKFSCNAGIS